MISAAPEPFGRNLWLLAGERVHMFGIPFETRMTIIRLSNGGLWVHSPIAPTEERRAALAQLGTVEVIVAPNRLHSLHLNAFAKSHPEAEIWVSPDFGTRHTMPAGAHVLGAEIPVWADEIAVLPVPGHSLIDEVAFIHHASRTLILTDIVQNHRPASDNWFWRAVKRLNGIVAPGGGVPRDYRFSLSDRAAFAEAIAKILGQSFEKITFAHGLPVSENGHAYFAEATCFARHWGSNPDAWSS